MEASALVEYFKPLQDWLEKKNKETGAHIGWVSEFGKYAWTSVYPTGNRLNHFIFYYYRMSLKVGRSKNREQAIKRTSHLCVSSWILRLFYNAFEQFHNNRNSCKLLSTFYLINKRNEQ